MECIENFFTVNTIRFFLAACASPFSFSSFFCSISSCGHSWCSSRGKSRCPQTPLCPRLHFVAFQTLFPLLSSHFPQTPRTVPPLCPLLSSFYSIPTPLFPLLTSRVPQTPMCSSRLDTVPFLSFPLSYHLSFSLPFHFPFFSFSCRRQFSKYMYL